MGMMEWAQSVVAGFRQLSQGTLWALYALFGGVLYLVWKFNPFSGGLYETLYLVGFALCVVIFVIILLRNAVVRPFKSVAEGFRNPIWKKKEDEGKKKEKEKEEIPEWEKKREEKRRRKAIERGRKITEERARKEAERTRGDEDFTGDPLEARAKRRNGEEAGSTGNPDDIYGYRKTRTSRESEYDPFYDDPYGYGKASAAEEPKIYLSAVEADTLIHEYSDRFEVYDLDGGKKTLRSIEYKDGRR